MQLNPNKPIYLTVLLSILFMLFFWGGPDIYSVRSLKYFWNLGHIIFFAVLPVILIYPLKDTQSDKLVFVYILMATLVLGGSIELVQSGQPGRTRDPDDMVRNIIGALTFWVFLSPYRKRIAKIRLVLVQGMVSILIFLQLSPIAIALWDENSARRQFPLLSDFESSLEVDRWTGGAAFEITNEVKKSGNASLKVTMDTSRYSGVSLKHFPKNWQEYKIFRFAVFNPDDINLKLTCRIHDERHTQGRQRYSDRFNHSFKIDKGWHIITIPLKNVMTAPQGRNMDMQRIQGIGIFSKKLTSPQTIYLDAVELTK